MRKRWLTIVLTVILAFTFTAANVFAADALGTRQQITKEELEGGTFLVYHAVENGQTLTLYCFNRDLAWPVTGSPELTEYYVPDEMLNLEDGVKNKIYRILYAGYPYNNAGLYSSSEDPVTMDELAEACIPPQALKDLMPEIEWGGLDFTPENLVGTTPETDAMDGIALAMCTDDDVEVAALTKPDFYYLISVFSYGPYDSVDNLKEMYAAMRPSTTPGGAHDATQLAIWRVLYLENVPNNNESMEDCYKSNSLVRDLVDFAYKDERFADIKVPDRGTTIAQMENYKSEFETGAKLLRADGSPVGNGIIVFTEDGDGKFISEPLHFAESAYALPYEITLNDGSTAVFSVVNHGTGEFELVADEKPTQGQVTIKTDNMFPSDVYQYVVESQQGILAAELSHDAGHIQDMSGVYYQTVPMELSFGTEFREAGGSLQVSKKVTGDLPDSEKDKEFEFTVTLSDKTINGRYGSMTFKDGVATFTLKDGETIQAEGLPANTEYAVEETPYENYVTSKSHETGTIAKGMTTQVSFYNEYKAGSASISGDSRTGKNIDFTNKYSQSGTGVDSGDDARLLLMALIMMITAGGICAVLFLGRFRRKSEQND